MNGLSCRSVRLEPETAFSRLPLFHRAHPEGQFRVERTHCRNDASRARVRRTPRARARWQAPLAVLALRDGPPRLDKDEGSLRQFVEQRLGPPQVESLEPLREPAVDR